MVEYISSGGSIRYARETTYGVAPVSLVTTGSGTAPARAIGIINQNIDFPDKELEVRQYHNFGTGRKWFQNRAGKRTRNGSLGFLPTNGEMFYFLFGQDSTSGGGPFTHSLSVATVAVLPSFSIGAFLDTQEVNDFYRVFKGCVVNSMAMSLSEGQELQCTMDFMARGIESHTNPNFSPELGWMETAQTTDGQNTPPIPYMFYDTQANVAISSPYTRTIARVKDFSFSVSNNLQPKYYFQAPTTPTGSTQYSAQDPFNYLTSNVTYDLTMTIVPAGHVNGTGADALYDILDPAAGTPPEERRFDVTIPFTRGGNANDTITFLFKNCMLSKAPHSWNEDGSEVTVSASFIPEDITVTVVDSLSTYSGLSAST